MKKIMLLNWVLILVMNVSGQSKDEKAVAEAVERLRMGMINADKTELEKLVSDGLSYGHSSGYVEGKNEFIEKITSGKSDFVTIQLSDQVISIHGHIAIVRHTFKAVTNDNGKANEVQLKVLLLWQKQGGKWKLLARQAVKFV
jgi:ketosteroid isomerase-like protein